MRFRKATVLVSLFMVCFVLAAQSAKADDIVFNDITDTISVTGAATGRLTVVSCGAEIATCIVTLGNSNGITLAPAATIVSTTLLPTFLMAESTSTTAAGTPVSDGLSTVNLSGSTSLLGATTLVFTFHSDPPPLTLGGPEINLAPCPVTQLDGVHGCNVTENGTPQLAGTITWSNGTVDNIFLASDSVEPEPATLILFGSGLVMVGGFLRRRRRPVATSAVA
jgi:hypothetical protein